MPIEIIQYDTLEECMAAFLKCDTNELPNGRWEWMDGDRFRVWSMRRVMRSRRKIGTWGFCEDKRNIHVWVADHAAPKDVAKLLGHELGHMERPHHRAPHIEESKANRYGDVASLAFKITATLTKGKCDRGRSVNFQEEAA